MFCWGFACHCVQKCYCTFKLFKQSTMQPAVIALCPCVFVHCVCLATVHVLSIYIYKKDTFSTGQNMWAVHTKAETEAQCNCTQLLLSNEGVSDMLVNLQLNIEDVENTVCSSSFNVMYLSPDFWVCCVSLQNCFTVEKLKYSCYDIQWLQLLCYCGNKYNTTALCLDSSIGGLSYTVVGSNIYEGIQYIGAMATLLACQVHRPFYRHVCSGQG